MAYLVIGLLLALCAAASLALAMVIQRYALACPTEMVPLCGFNFPRNIVWFVGLVTYGIANGFYAMSLLFGPLSLLAGVFTTLLVFNMIFAKYFLAEELTPPRVMGAVLILCGAVLCVAGTPITVETDFTPRDVAELTLRATGASYLSVLFGIVCLSVLSIKWFEFHYPSRITDDAAVQPCETGESDKLLVEAVPSWLDTSMGIVYPGSLGVDEGIAHLTMKASLSMLDNCSAEGQCRMPILYVYIVVWIIASIATLWWLRRVFTRYESTSALPVEYGSVNAVSVCSGLIFYRESRFMTNWQISLLVVGVCVILSGISTGRLKMLPPMFCSVSAMFSLPSDSLDNYGSVLMSHKTFSEADKS